MTQNEIEINVETKENGNLAILDDHGGVSVLTGLHCVGLIATAGFRCCGGSERLFEVADDVVNVLSAD